MAFHRESLLLKRMIRNMDKKLLKDTLLLENLQNVQYFNKEDSL